MHDERLWILLATGMLRTPADGVFVPHCHDNAALLHLICVAPFWRQISDSDWQSSMATRGKFNAYVDGQLKKEIRQQQDQVHRQASQHGISYEAVIHQGHFSQCILEVEKKYPLRWIITTEELNPGGDFLQRLNTPITIVPSARPQPGMLT